MEMEKASRSKAFKASKSSKGSVKHAEPVSQRQKPYEEPEDEGDEDEDERRDEEDEDDDELISGNESNSEDEDEEEDEEEEGDEDEEDDEDEGLGLDITLQEEAVDYAQKLQKRGVIYISRIPPFMKPNKVRSCFEVYGEVTRLYLGMINTNIY
jgi:ESF2/ABP1 family protein